MGGTSAHLSAAVRRIPDPAPCSRRTPREVRAVGARLAPGRRGRGRGSALAGLRPPAQGCREGGLVVAAADRDVLHARIRLMELDGRSPDLAQQVLGRPDAGQGRTPSGSSSRSWCCSAASAAWLAGGSGTLRNATQFLNILASDRRGHARSSRSSRSRRRSPHRPGVAQPVPMALPPQPAGRGRPDIYYIILDGYARHDVMKSHFGYDNRGVPRAPGAEGILRRAAQHGQLLPDAPLPLLARSIRPTSTTWSRDWASTRPS